MLVLPRWGIFRSIPTKRLCRWQSLQDHIIHFIVAKELSAAVPAARNKMPLPRFGAVFAALLMLTTEALASQQELDHQSVNSSTNWPSLLFNFTVKRSSMKVYGQSEFSMLATPVLSVNNTRVLYDDSTHFIQGANVLSYMEVGGVAYLSTSLADGSSFTPPPAECFHSESGDIPSINSIIAGINEATAVSSSGDADECSTGGDLFKMSVNGIVLALCLSTSSGFTMKSNDLDISVEYLKNDIAIKPPTAQAGTLPACSTSSLSSTVTPIGQSFLTGNPQALDHTGTRKLDAAFDFSLDDSCSCKSKPRPCVFVHGLGVKKEMARNRDRFYYWGDLEGHAPCCSSMTYTYLNTSGNPWTSDTLQQKVCTRVGAVSDTSTSSGIADTIVVTHSMGTLMLAGAIANGKCSLDSSSTWVGLAGPMKGSMCSDFIQDSCTGKATAVLETVAEVTGKCPPTTGLKSLPYEGEKYSSAALDAAYKAAQEAYRENVYAAMCGASYAGLVSVYQPVFWMLGKTVPHKSRANDGMVEFDSCAAGFPDSKFGNSYRDRFYRTKLNHFDMEFVSADALLDASKMPAKWFECLL
ncbi:hypothetical protein PHYPSEUDO_014383 [Phytophthora pseudosyringae]|uniref:Uncharacterized protein n=1 Tax=Phytophthora pseudosyringae TaxID=221518 RepID=A0A8T1W696_9STRA|nr:hypothetical protein PHYPSEUDO_014383 [Phytophthora pseudosyringae]